VQERCLLSTDSAAIPAKSIVFIGSFPCRHQPGSLGCPASLGSGRVLLPSSVEAIFFKIFKENPSLHIYVLDKNPKTTTIVFCRDTSLGGIITGRGSLLRLLTAGYGTSAT
jgi:hypothetical protein